MPRRSLTPQKPRAKLAFFFRNGKQWGFVFAPTGQDGYLPTARYSHGARAAPMAVQYSACGGIRKFTP